ncbi:hypothetical protein Pmani_022973 [Petrolisthes manimaculis]|uniref:Uncharacterized protein n=1 Tax=Petrolisthes manimaculis TaxID=1843537 RepID=A0AAE1U0N0_9EUCA|nr:hypothetical protein Pmani_022973 [Petrolisthes manimaculis]
MRSPSFSSRLQPTHGPDVAQFGRLVAPPPGGVWRCSELCSRNTGLAFLHRLILRGNVSLEIQNFSSEEGDYGRGKMLVPNFSLPSLRLIIIAI